MDSSQKSSGASAAAGNGGIIQTDDAAEDQKQNLNQVINSIQKTLGLLHQLYLTVSSFNVASQLPLLQRLYISNPSFAMDSYVLKHPCFRNAVVTELDTMQRLSENCNIQVPMEVLNLIDDGKNPDEFTRDVLNGCIAKNQITKGKTDAFKLASLEERITRANFRDTR
ncbi:hypothetical protein HHK36_027409 [Tetracentron sinense]|uniref:Mediator of RNA polymerase II transcription subunit 10 n=1 Tax=Tetracentron sinense TaxID=13715 RepID=A0A834YHU5_TETSI|nr:hypothetical protein HHK36_027409 [Tetracentron sinense]